MSITLKLRREAHASMFLSPFLSSTVRGISAVDYPSAWAVSGYISAIRHQLTPSPEVPPSCLLEPLVPSELRVTIYNQQE